MIDIKMLQQLNKLEKLVITEHARLRLIERDITIGDIVECIKNGEIIKQYEDDKPFPSCLLLGKSIREKYIHIVVSHDDEWIYLVTAYYPDGDTWESDFKTRKEC